MITTNESLQSIYASPILIVDDVEVNRLMLEKTLRSRGFTNIMHAEDGAQALAMVEKHHPEMVVLDVLMPVMDGFECCAKLRQPAQYRDLPILIQTALTKPEMRFKAFTQGATDIVSKPVDPDEFYARVMVHLEKRLYLKELKEYHDRTKQEMHSARDLQHSILPSAEDLADIRRKCGLDVAAHFVMSSDIGGDLWGMKNLFPSQTAFWVVDFSGHGVSAALNSFRLQAYMKEHSAIAARPGDYLWYLNEKLLQLLKAGQFATMFYAIIDTEGGKMHYAAAASTHPIILRAGTGKAELVDASGQMLGVGLNSYATQAVDFRPGDQVLFYSDALTETPDENGKCIDEEELMRLMQSRAGATSADMLNMLVTHFDQQAQDRVRDDLTLCLCKRGG